MIKTFEEFVYIAQKWNELGWAVQDQFEELVSPYFSPEGNALNSNAVNMIEKFMRFQIFVGFTDKEQLERNIEMFRKYEAKESEEDYAS